MSFWLNWTDSCRPSSAEAADDGDVTSFSFDAGPSAETVKVPEAWTESPGGDHTQFVQWVRPAVPRGTSRSLAHLLWVLVGKPTKRVTHGRSGCPGRLGDR